MRFRRRSPKLLTGDDAVLRKVTDDLPRDHLYAQPLVVDRIRVDEAEPLDDGQWRVAFVVRVRDADGKRCPDLAVDATLVGPHRQGTGTTTTDLMGQATFRMTGPAGRYVLTVDDVAAGGLTWDDTTVTRAEVVAGDA